MQLAWEADRDKIRDELAGMRRSKLLAKPVAIQLRELTTRIEKVRAQIKREDEQIGTLDEQLENIKAEKDALVLARAQKEAELQGLEADRQRAAALPAPLPLPNVAARIRAEMRAALEGVDPAKLDKALQCLDMLRSPATMPQPGG